MSSGRKRSRTSQFIVNSNVEKVDEIQASPPVKKETMQAVVGAADSDAMDPQTALKLRDCFQLWYDAHKRPLPWRGASPYGVWVSEIMCQQTKVDTVIPYYNRWMNEFPTVEALAKATIDDINKVWAGLGYYRRAKFLHEGAAKVYQDFSGVLPTSKKDLMQIKGIGDYTSSAIASICYKERVPAVDGNVIRVFSRLKAVSMEGKDKALQKRATVFATSVVETSDRPGDLNQAMMEIGAMICTPRKPKCSECPIKEFCKAYDVEDGDLEAICEKYPARPSEKAQVPEKHVYVAVVTGVDQSVLAVRRPNDGGLLANQWELVCVEKDDHQEISVDHIKLKLKELGACVDCHSGLHDKSVGTYKHIFSHLKHNVTSFLFDVSRCKSPKCLALRPNSENFKWIPKKELRRAGLTRSMTKALEICGLLLK